MTRTAEQKAVLALELAATTAISVNWLLYIYLVVNGQALQTSIAYLTTPLLNVALGVGMFAVQSPTFPWMAIVLAASFSVYGLLKRYVPLDAIAQAENDKDMRQWEPLNSMLLISSTLAFARYDDKRMWTYDVIENAMTRNLGEYLTRWGPGLLRLGAIMSFGGYCVSRPGLLRLGAVVG